MAPNLKVFKAYTAMRALGIPDEEVKPVLKQLLKVYDKNWELIEEDNYRTLVDAYFELKENNGAAQHNDEFERSAKRMHLEEQEDRASSIIDNSSQTLSIEENEIPPRTSGQGIMELSQPCLREGRTEYSSQLSLTQFTGKGKDPISSHVVARERKPTSERASSAMYGKKPMHEPSSAHFQREIVPSNHHNVQRETVPSNHHNKMLIPKNDQSTDDFSPEPIAILPPALPRLSNGSTGNHSVKTQASQYAHRGNKDDSSACDDSTSTFDIASSLLGEVKISLNCGSALRQQNFHIPKLDTVLKFVEDKYLRSYKIVGPQFSVRKLLKDLCESYLKLAIDSPNRSVVGNSSSYLGIDVRDASHITGPKKRAFGIHISETDSNRKGSDCSGNTNSHNLVHDEKKPCRHIRDIAKGAEKVKISLVDEIGSEHLPKFNYIPQNIIYQNANVNISLARIADEDCCSGCSGDCLSSSIPCACARETGGEFAYTPQGLLKEEFFRACMSIKQEPQEHHFLYCQDCPLERTKNEYLPERCKGHLVRKFIKECWRKCGCDMRCGNRVVQRGITCKLQVFLTCEGKGWGLRTLEDLPMGTFICEYVGEILTNMELYERIMQSSGNERHTYPVTLDADWGSEGGLLDEEALCLDATCHGNVARFINHRCFDANLVEIPVEVETPDRHYYHLAFFTTRKVEAFQELTWDYGIDFDDRNHPIKAFQCCCGSAFCRDMKQKGARSKAITLR